MEFSLIIPAFIAGFLTFLAPCTLPLVPGYLGFISGVSLSDLKNPGKIKTARRKIFLNGLFYVIGFSVVFITLGSLFGLGGGALVKYRLWLSRLGGLLIIFFGLFMLKILKPPFLNREKHLVNIKFLKSGRPGSSLLFGATFAFGWTPCIGPILGSILTLAASRATVGQGMFLLVIFSLGLAAPFLIIAAGIGSASTYLSKLNKYLNLISIIGGVFLVFLGVLLLTDNLIVWTSYFYRIFGFIHYERLLDYL